MGDLDCLDEALLGLGGGGLMIGIDKLAEVIKKLLNKARPPAAPIPPLLTTIEGSLRTGMSPIVLTANVIRRLGEAGIDTSTLPDGSEPQIVKVVRIVFEELIKEVHLNSKIDMEISPGTNVGMAGPVPVIAVAPIKGNGLLR